MDDKSLPDSNHDQALKGEWADYRQCHIKPDLLLIYSKRGNDMLRPPELARIPNYFDSTSEHGARSRAETLGRDHLIET